MSTLFRECTTRWSLQSCFESISFMWMQIRCHDPICKETIKKQSILRNFSIKSIHQFLFCRLKIHIKINNFRMNFKVFQAKFETISHVFVSTLLCISIVTDFSAKLFMYVQYSWYPCRRLEDYTKRNFLIRLWLFASVINLYCMIITIPQSLFGLLLHPKL